MSAHAPPPRSLHDIGVSKTINAPVTRSYPHAQRLSSRLWRGDHPPPFRDSPEAGKARARGLRCKGRATATQKRWLRARLDLFSTCLVPSMHGNCGIWAVGALQAGATQGIRSILAFAWQRTVGHAGRGATAPGWLRDPRCPAAAAHLQEPHSAVTPHCSRNWSGYYCPLSTDCCSVAGEGSNPMLSAR